QVGIEALAPDMQQLEQQIRRIEDANAAAESLPVDLQELQRARETIAKTSSQASELIGKIDAQHKTGKEASQDTARLRDEAEKLVRQSEEAYRITTSIGLAGAFDQRASRLGRTVWVWVFLLGLALAAAVYLGAERVKLLSTELGSNNTN